MSNLCVAGVSIPIFSSQMAMVTKAIDRNRSSGSIWSTLQLIPDKDKQENGFRWQSTHHLT